MSPVWFSEIEPFPSRVLKHHWPAVPNLGDMMALPGLIRFGIVPAPAVLVGGTPCQAFSVAGARRGLEDDRGQLTMTYVEILNEIDKQRPGDEAACVWENVPGVLSSADNAFGCFLGLLSGSDAALHPEPQPPAGKSSKWWRWNKRDGEHRIRWPNAGCVSGPQRAIAWRTLDAQYFGVAQRRRRVFVVASARAGLDPTAVLFERESGRRDSPPRRSPGQDAAGTVTAGARKSDRGDGTDLLIPAGGCWWDGGQVSQTLDAVLHKGQTMPEKNRFPAVLQAAVPILEPGGRTGKSTSDRRAGIGIGNDGDPMFTLQAAQQHGVFSNMTVRRLMPVEGERLQGFPDNHTNVPGAKDTPRYKAIGNSKAVPVVQWIGRRLLAELEKTP